MQWDGVHDLIDRAKERDAGAWHALHVMAQPFLLGLARQVLGANWMEQSVENLLQDTWTRAFSNLSNFRGGENDAQTGAMFRAWLKQIMRNVHGNNRRYYERNNHAQPAKMHRPDARAPSDSQSDNGWGNISAGMMTASAELQLQERAALVRQAIDGLTESDRELVRLRYFEELTYGQIAARLDINEDTLRSRLTRILESLGGKLQSLE